MIKPGNKIEPVKIKSFKYLINQIKKKHTETESPKHALLIGAGCSYKCGIPLGSQIIELCKIHSFIENEIIQPPNFWDLNPIKFNFEELEKYLKQKKEWDNFQKYVKEKESYLKELVVRDKDIYLNRIISIFGALAEDEKKGIWKSFEKNIVADCSYGFWMDQYSSEDPLTRQKLIEDIIEGKKPNGAYILLSYLIDQGIFTNLLTTNFDDLINEALVYYTESRCRFYADDEISQYISIYSKKPNIIKVHGDYRYANIKNTDNETDKLSGNISIKLKELLSQLGLIVVGYNGADHSIMSVLYDFKKNQKFPFPVLWCGQNPNNVHWRVAQLINNTENSFFVEIEGFDQMIGKLAPELFINAPEFNKLAEKAKKREQEIDKYLHDFGIDFKNSAASVKEKKNLRKTLDKWHYYSKAYEIKDPLEQMKLYNKAIELDSSFAEAYNDRADVYRELGDYENALKDVTVAIKLNPKYRFSYGTLAEIYGEMGEEEKFYEAIENALKLGYKIDNYLNDKQYEKAYKLFKGQARFKELLEKYRVIRKI